MTLGDALNEHWLFFSMVAMLCAHLLRRRRARIYLSFPNARTEDDDHGDE